MSVNIWTDENGVEFILHKATDDGSFNCSGCHFHDRHSSIGSGCTFDEKYPNFSYPESDNKPCVDGNDEYIFIKN